MKSLEIDKAQAAIDLWLEWNERSTRIWKHGVLLTRNGQKILIHIS